MDINGVVSSTAYTGTASYAYESTSSKKTEKKETNTSDSYEKASDKKGDSTKKLYKKDSQVIQKLQADLENRKKQLSDLVSSTLHGQANANMKLCDLFSKIKDGTYQVDAKTVEQAKKDVADDGYWGVEQTSDRFVQFAKALSGGDPDKAEELMNAVRKGFKQATRAWGDTLPDICQRTLEATEKKFNDWKEGK